VSGPQVFPGLLGRPPSLTALAVALALGALEWVGVWALVHRGRERPRPTLTGPEVAGVTLAFVLSGILTAAAVDLVQAPLQLAVNRWMVAHLATADPLILTFPAVLLSGLVQEPTKLAAALIGAAVARRRPGPADPATVLLYGGAAGLGFGVAEAAWVLTIVFEAVPSLGAGAIAWPLVERVSATLFHLAATGLTFYLATLGLRQGLAGLALLSVAHGLLNYGAVSLSFLVPGAGLLIEAFVALSSVGLTLVLVAVMRREPAKTQEDDKQ